MKKESGKNKHSERYACSYYCLFNSPLAWVVLSSQREAVGGGGGGGMKVGIKRLIFLGLASSNFVIKARVIVS